MKYDKIKEALFLERPNRFIARVLVDGEEEVVHVKNTGRCKELLQKDVKVFLEDHLHKMNGRKTRYSLITVEKRDARLKKGFRYVNIDSQSPNKAVAEALASGKILLPGFGSELKHIKAESVFGESRFDFYVEGCSGEKAFIEVKGVTLEDEGVVRFPDAPTERGVKHVRELIQARSKGYLTYVIFVIQMSDVLYFEPNDETHPEFGEALREAKGCGVEVLAYDCIVSEDSMEISQEVAVKV